MAIPIKRYIDIGTTLINASSGERDFSALVFTPDEMFEPEYDAEHPENETALHKKYVQYTTNGEVVTLTSAEVEALFVSVSDTTTVTRPVASLASKYFGYSSINGRSPSYINVVKVGTTAGSAKAKFSSVMNVFNNFGTFTFIGYTPGLGTSGSGDLLDVATANQEFGFHYTMVIPVTLQNYSGFSTKLMDVRGTHLVLDSATTEYTAWMPMAFVGSLNYTIRNSASTMMYKVFGGVTDSVVSDPTTADDLDKARVNYIGIVQSRGTVRKFYQTGVNMDGTDLGVYVDASWITSEIENGWIDLATGSNRIPANAQGATAVSTMITSVAERAITNGCILLDKPLTSNQKQSIRDMIGDGGVTAIQSVGYFVSAQVVFEENKYICRYVLVYAKGDTIQKVVGQHYLA